MPRQTKGDQLGRAFTAGTTDDKLYLIGTQSGTAEPVFDFSTISKEGWPRLMRMTKNGKRLFVSMNTAGKVAMLDHERSSQTPATRRPRRGRAGRAALYRADGMNAAW